MARTTPGLLRLKRYLDRIYNTLYSRRDIESTVTITETDEPSRGVIDGRVTFWDGSFLEIAEVTIPTARGLKRLSYAYHYQRADGTTVFRYDNTPHHPEIASTFPHHKHVGEMVESAEVNDLHDVIQEIDRYLCI